MPSDDQIVLVECDTRLFEKFPHFVAEELRTITGLKIAFRGTGIDKEWFCRKIVINRGQNVT